MLERVATVTPGDAMVHAGIAEIHRNAGRFTKALGAYDAAVEAGHDRPAVIHAFRGSMFATMGQPEQAAAAFRQSLALDDSRAATWFDLGVAAQRMGDRDAALGAYDHAIEADPDHGQAYRMRSNLVTFTADDPGIAAMEAALARLERAASEGDAGNDAARQVMHIGFGLAKAYDELSAEVGTVDRAFATLKQANDGKRATLEYDVANDEEFARRTKKYFGHDNFVRLHGAGVPSDKPVFVIGMPRSGTTLVEQILASHSAIHGAGEIPHLMRIALAPRKDVQGHRARNVTSYRGSSYLSMPGTGPEDVPFPEYVQDLASEGLAFRAQAYLNALDHIAPDALRVVDKTPINFMFAGFIRLAFPKARIINCVRDPMDTCFSCYKKHFSVGPNFAYDLDDLGRYYNLYADLMDHWRSVMPDAILDLVYEDLVGDLEANARRLIDFVGLDWEEACLQFHETNRIIDTASNMQVRQPLNDRSVGAWKKYEAHLGPLAKALTQT